MPFSDYTKRIARRKAHYRCVGCHEPFVDVHHIIPESKDGSNKLDNAAPLCAGCHDAYGNNPDKRRQIREMRDFWYDVCRTRYASSDVSTFKRLDELYEMTKTVKDDQAKVLKEIKSTLSGALASSARYVGESTSLNEVTTDSGYITSGAMLSENVYANVNCRKCGTHIGLLVGTNKCPNCGNPIGA